MVVIHLNDHTGDSVRRCGPRSDEVGASLTSRGDAAATRIGNELSITFQRPAHIGDVTYFAEASDTLLTWENVAWEILNPGSDPETVRATKTLPEPPPGKQFIRLRFSN